MTSIYTKKNTNTKMFKIVNFLLENSDTKIVPLVIKISFLVYLLECFINYFIIEVLKSIKSKDIKTFELFCRFPSYITKQVAKLLLHRNFQQRCIFLVINGDRQYKFNW